MLLIEDDKDLCAVVTDALKALRYQIEVVHDGKDGWHLLSVSQYDLVILDWDLPGRTGIEILRQLRANKNLTPVLMLTGKDTLDDKELGFDSGTDDYVSKPCNMRELMMRVKAIIRRAALSPDHILRAGSCCLDPQSYTVLLQEQELTLARKEFSLLELFMRNPNQIFQPDALIEHVWGRESDATTETLRTTLNRLRKKLQSDSQAPKIETVYGVGYKLTF